MGLVKLMGRSSGFIAMQASMASGESVRSMPAILAILTSCCYSMRHLSGSLQMTSLVASHAHTKEQAYFCNLCRAWAGCMPLVMSGAIAGVVDICLIPEVHFTEDKLMAYIDKQLQKKGHAVICVAEGAGQDMLMKSGTHQGFDASGNPILQDVGTYLRHIIRKKLEVQTSAQILSSSCIAWTVLICSTLSTGCS